MPAADGTPDAHGPAPRRPGQIRAALRLVARRPLRSSLAGTGVAIAVGTLLVAVAGAERARARATEEIRRMGADVLVIDAAVSRNIADRARRGGIVTSLTDADARDITVRVADVSIVAAELRGTLPMKVGDLARQVTVSGDDAAYGELRAAAPARGRFFSSAEDAGAQRVAVLGAGVAADLFQGADPMNAVVRLGGAPFVVIGVLGERGTGVDAFDEDQAVFVPLRTARRRLFNTTYVQRIFVRAATGADLDDVAEAVRTLVAARHPHRSGDSLDFRVQDQRRLVEMRQGAADRLRTFASSVAAAMFAAGGGGMFALQLLAVRERRTEIGIRRALGATKVDVFSHFAIESMAVSAAGTAFGVVLGRLGVALVGAALPGTLIVFAATTALAICMVATALPCLRAARLPVAVALRLR